MQHHCRHAFYLPVGVITLSTIREPNLFGAICEVPLNLSVGKVIELRAIGLGDMRCRCFSIVVDDAPVESCLLNVTVSKYYSLHTIWKHLLARACRVKDLASTRAK